MNCRNIEIICNDASTYNFPDEPLILFMYHPFELPVMMKVIENVTATFKKHPRRIVIVYFNPKYSELLDSTKFLERIITTPEYHIYDTQP